MKRYSFIIIFIILSSKVFSQLKSFKWDLDKNQIENINDIPYDEPFYLTFEKAGLIKPALSYKLAQYDEGNFKHKHYRFKNCKPKKCGRSKITNCKPCSLNFIDGYLLVDQDNSSTEGKFQLLVPPLHPNEVYKLKLEGISQLKMSDDSKSEFNKKFKNIVSETYNYRLKSIDTDKMYKSLNSLLSEYSNGGQYYSNNLIILDRKKLYDDIDFKNYFFDLKEIHTALNDDLSKICVIDPEYTNTEVNSIYNFVADNYSQLENVIDKILTSKEFTQYRNNYTGIGSNFKNEFIFKTLKDDFKNGFFKTRKDTIACGFDSSCKVLNILLGKLKFDGNGLQSSDIFHKETIDKMISSFNNLSLYGGLNKSDSLLIEEFIDKLSTYSNLVNSFHTAYTTLESSKLEVASNFLKLYKPYKTSNIINTLENVSSQETGYLGIDVGFIYGFGLNALFLYEGANIHFRPVNRNAKLSNLKTFPDIFLKKFSLSFGIAQKLSSGNPEYRSFFAESSPFLGMGYRITNMLRINGGILWYKQTNPNPLIDKNLTKMTSFVSLSVDFKLKGAFNFLN